MKHRWPTVPLGEVLVALESGSRPKGGVAQFADGVPSLGGEHLNADGGFDFSEIRFIPRSFFNSLRRGRIRKSDVLLVKDGATTGKVSFVGEDFPFPEAAVNEHLFVLRPNTAKIMPKFLFYAVFRDEGQKQIRRSFHGAAQGGISQSFAGEFLLPLPPLSEQERIVGILDEAEGLRQRRAQADRRTAELLPALFHHMFGDPATNPKRWPVVTLGEIGGPGQYGLNAAAAPQQEGVRFVRITDIDDRGQLREAEAAYVPSDLPDLAKYELHEGDILIARSGATAGKSYLHAGLPFRAVFAGYLIRFRIEESKALPAYVAAFLRTKEYWRQLYSFKRAVAQPNVNAKQLSSLRIPLPPLSLQQEFAERVGEVRELERRQAESRRRLDALFAALLDRAFSGDL